MCGCGRGVKGNYRDKRGGKDQSKRGDGLRRECVSLA
jgi:hypothetical protein